MLRASRAGMKSTQASFMSPLHNIRPEEKNNTNGILILLVKWSALNYISLVDDPPKYWLHLLLEVMVTPADMSGISWAYPLHIYYPYRVCSGYRSRLCPHLLCYILCKLLLWSRGRKVLQHTSTRDVAAYPGEMIVGLRGKEIDEVPHSQKWFQTMNVQ